MVRRLPPRLESRRPRLSSLLAASAIGVYLLVVAGATTAIADGVRACSTWPTCQGPLLEDPRLAIAWGHRVTAAVVGVLVAATCGLGLTADTNARVRALLVAALALYPLQVALGALVATTGAPGVLPGVHLATGMTIFAALVGALAWHLEAETGSDDRQDAAAPVASPVDGSIGSPTTSTAPGADEAVTGTDGAASADTATSAETEPTAEKAAEPVTGLERAVWTVRAYGRLTKPRLMWLLCLVAAAGMALAAGPDLSIRTVVLTLGGGVLAIGASGTFNHVLERDVDQRMQRTADRPIPSHRIPVRRATAFGIALALASITLFWQVNALAAALGLAAILFYSVVYTVVLKPNTVQNTVIGGFSGSLPALIGWVAVTGRIDLPGLALAGLIFLWTPAHFYNLALAYEDDYARAGFPMMPVVRGATETRKHVLWYLGATLVAAGAMTTLTPLGPLYAATTTALGSVFVWAVLRLHREQTDRAAFRAFHASNAYLGAVLVAVVVDSLVL